MAETYEISVTCRNCGHVPGGTMTNGNRVETIPEKFTVPKGTGVKTFLQEMTCNNCGCEGYMGLLNQPG